MIDKMYLMMPSYNVVHNRRTVDAVSRKLIETIKGETLKESIVNFHDFYKQVVGEEAAFDDEVVMNLLENETPNEDRLDAFRDLKNKIVAALFSEDNYKSHMTQDIARQLDLEIDPDDLKFVYADRPGTKEASQNRIIELYKAVLTHPKVAKDVMLPIDFEFLKTDVTDLTKDFAGDTSATLYHFEPLSDIDLMFDFRSGKAGVGQEANWMVDISRQGKLSFSGVPGFKWFENTDNEQLRKNADSGIIQLDPEYSYPLSKDDLAYYRKALAEMGFKPSKVDSIMGEVENVKIASALTAILNGFVDIAKDPFITRGNWITTTTNIGNVLLRTGIHPLYVNAFMAQPILRSYVEASKNKVSKNHKLTPRNAYLRTGLLERLSRISFKGTPVSALYDKMVSEVSLGVVDKKVVDLSFEGAFNATKLLNAVGIKANSKTMSAEEYNQHLEDAMLMVNFVYDEHIETFRRSRINPTDTSVFNLEFYREQVTKPEVVDREFQKAILDKFLEYSEMNQRLGENIRLSKVDTSGTGASISEMVTLYNLKSHMQNVEDNMPSVLKLNGIRSKFEGTMLGNYFKNLTHVLHVATKNSELFPDLKKSNLRIANNIAYALTGGPITSPDLLKLINDHIYTSTMGQFFNINQKERIELLRDLPNEIIRLNKEGFKNDFVNALGVKRMSEESSVSRILALPNNKRSSVQEDLLTDAWRELMTSNPELSEKLIKYSYLTTGFQYTSSQFYTLIPHEYFIEKDVNKFIREYSENSDFESEFMSNNRTNKVITKLVKRIDSNAIVKGSIDSNGFKSTYSKSEPILRFVKKDGVLHEAIAELDGILTYVKIQPKGYTVGNLQVPEYNVSFEDRLSAIGEKAAQRAVTEQEALRIALSGANMLSFEQHAYSDDIEGEIIEFKETHRNVHIMKYTDLKGLDLFSLEGINTINNKNTKNSFGNPFTGSRAAGGIDVNPNMLTVDDVKLIQSGKSKTPVNKLIENLEAATQAFENWLKGDDSLIPSERLEELTARRKFIQTQLKSPYSETNRLLNNNGKFLHMIDRVRGVKYYSHADVLADFSDRIRHSPQYQEAVLLRMREEAEVDFKFEDTSRSTKVENEKIIQPVEESQADIMFNFESIVKKELIEKKVTLENIEKLRQDVMNGLFTNTDSILEYVKNCM